MDHRRSHRLHCRKETLVRYLNPKGSTSKVSVSLHRPFKSPISVNTLSTGDLVE